MGLREMGMGMGMDVGMYDCGNGLLFFFPLLSSIYKNEG